MTVASAGGLPTETGETGWATVPNTQVLDPWSPSVGVHLNGPAGDANGNSSIALWRTQLTIGLGLIEGLEVTAALPYLQFERDVPGHRHTDDIGGLRLGGKYRLFDEHDGAWASVALLGAAVIGTGNDNFPAILDRNSAYGRRETWEIMAIADKVLWTTPAGDDLTMTLNAGGLFFDQPKRFSRQNQSAQFQRRFDSPVANFENPFQFAAALQIPAYTSDRFRIDVFEEFRGNTGIIEEVRGSLPTWLFTGVRMAADNGLALQGGFDIGLSGYLDPYRFLASLSYAMPASTPAEAETVRHVSERPALEPPATIAPPPSRKKLVLRGVNFDFDRADIRPDSMVILREAADTLRGNPEIMVLVVGHTDALGSDEYNQRLSLQRSVAVRDQLVRFGVPAGRLTVRGRGESEPIASNDSEAGRAENRRVELIVQ
jgi:outer membrane protein OmpA-like peptidoglycan-associated protein